MIDACCRLYAITIRYTSYKGNDIRYGEEAIETSSDDDEPLAALAFKIATDPFVGKT